MRFESRKGSKGKNKFVSWNFNFFWLFFHYSFSFALQKGFLKLEVTFP
jgi:hypothetical protein